MREIKFRAYSSYSEKMYSWDELLEYTATDIFSTDLETEWGGTLMQYTGLKDKNRKEIYEGDLLKCGSYDKEIPEDHFSVWSVAYNEQKCQFCVGNAHNLQISNMRNIEIIGNIYENNNPLK